MLPLLLLSEYIWVSASHLAAVTSFRGHCSRASLNVVSLSGVSTFTLDVTNYSTVITFVLLWLQCPFDACTRRVLTVGKSYLTWWWHERIAVVLSAVSSLLSKSSITTITGTALHPFVGGWGVGGGMVCRTQISSLLWWLDIDDNCTDNDIMRFHHSHHRSFYCP